MAYKKELISFLFNFLNDNRKELLMKDLAIRSNHLTLVAEDFYHAHNISATIRTSECFGLRELHVIENNMNYERNPAVNKGSDKWIRIRRFCSQEFNTPNCYADLRSRGYQIVATSPHKGSVTVRELDISRKTAIVMGSEGEGLSEYAMENADVYLHVHMPGFTESLNVSVTAGIILEHLSWRMRNENINWELSDEEKDDLMLFNMDKTIPECFLLEKHFIAQQGLTIEPQVFNPRLFRESIEIH